MKMIYGGTPVKSLKVKHYEVSTFDATVQPSDMQSGVTCYARGVKVTGTGKAFEFATYGRFASNIGTFIPTNDINTIVVSSTDGAIKMIDEINNLRDMDFSVAQEIAKVVLDGVEYSLTVQLTNNIITFGCTQTISIQAMIGKDNFI